MSNRVLGRDYRFVVENDVTTAVNVTMSVMARRYQMVGGRPIYEDSESEMVASAVVAQTAFSAGAAQTNSGGGAHIGGDFEFGADPAAGVSGDCRVYYETSTDGGTTWPGNGQGRVVATITFASSAALITQSFSLDD